MPTITFQCDSCRAYSTVALEDSARISCVKCSKSWPYVDSETFFQNCPLCQCKQFYIQKDFNRAVGCFIMLIGIILVPFSYGLSLPVLWLIDWLWHKKVHFMIICYRCGGEFRGFKIPEHLKTFRHPIGAKYDQ